MIDNNSMLIDRNLICNEDYNILSKNNFFHDACVEKLSFSILRNTLILGLSNENGIYSILIKKIFNFSCEIDFLVEEKYYDELSWDETFKSLPFRHLLSIEIRKSGYNEIAAKYMNSIAKTAIIIFDFKYNLKIDFIDMKIKKLS